MAAPPPFLVLLLVMLVSTQAIVSVRLPMQAVDPLSTKINSDDQSVLDSLASQWGSFDGSDTWTKSGRSCSYYTGVKCDSSGNVKNITLPSANVNGPLGDVTKLQHLEYFDLNGNSLSGSFSSISKLSSLKYIDVSSNGDLNPGFSAVTTLKSLSHFDIADTGYQGPIDTWFSKLDKLTYLDMSMNRLAGTVPGFLSKLKKLVYLNLASTGEEGLNGKLPAELSKLTNLKELYLHKNRFTGPVTMLTTLTKLERLLVGNNYLTGPIPDGFSKMKKLNYLSMRENSFSGRLPNFLGRLTALTFLSLPYNLFQGLVPRDLSKLTKLNTLYLNDNYLDGYVQPFTALKKLDDVDLSNNYLTGPPPKFYQAPSTLKLNDNYFFGSTFAVDRKGNNICAADLTNNCLSLPDSFSCDSTPDQRSASKCSDFCGTDGSVQCGGTSIGICYPGQKAVSSSKASWAPLCLCASGYKVSSDKQSCVKK
eukprot:TRINITY_DN69680_c0_g1_i1.p1 TRINITY_DN69680_c0_g1~~TRINITY_DN69680_c0_g1_i1.p1  ORF type:complete len:478 (+),score=49.50 TRINITY_DN69680_c0_g1_i1:58-1491(+)